MSTSNDSGLGPGQPQTIALAQKLISNLTTPELAAIVTAIELGMNVSQAIGFEKVQPLFTNKFPNGCPRAHDLVIEAFRQAMGTR